MLTPARLFRRLRSLLQTRTLDDELDEELAFHLQMDTERRMRDGLDADTARAEARRVFGGVSRHRDAARDARGVRPIEDLIQDLRVGARTLVKQRTYALVAILTLAIGIGATTALWAAVYRVLVAPYPFAEADRIVVLFETDVKSGGNRGRVASGNFLDWRARTRSLDLIAAAEPYSFDWIGPEGPERFGVALVTEDFFAIQGLRPVLGRPFVPGEFQPGQNNVVLLSETVWRNRFGADSSLLGRTLVLDSIPMVVVGVMPVDAMQPYAEEMWAPKIMRPAEETRRTSGYWMAIARRRPGVTLAQAQADMDGVARQLAAEHPTSNANAGIAVVSLREAIAGNARLSLLVLFGAVAFVLLIACVNVANLQLAEAMRRKRELAIRTAIGAGRGRLVRQLLTESALVSTVGALGGIGIAAAGVAAIRVFAPSGLWQLERLTLDVPALAFAFGIALVCAAAVTVLPVAAAARLQLAESLTSGGRGGFTPPTRRRANRVLVVSEVALALVLLVGAGLMVRSLMKLVNIDGGFATDRVLITTVQAWSYYPTQPQRAEFVRQAVERLEAIPGVTSVGVTSALPLAYPIGFERTPVEIEGQPRAPGDQVTPVRVTATTPGYFTSLEIPLRRGRMLAATDVAGSPPVALVNLAFVRRYFGSEDPLGKRVVFGFMGPPVPREIVGIIGDVRHRGLDSDPEPGVFMPHAQAATGALHFVVRTSADPALQQRAVRAELAALNGAMPLTDVTTMEALLGRSLRERRFQLGLLAAFSAIALLLSAIGIYGVMSRATSERQHEIGVRMAIGADAADVRRMVLRNGTLLAALGVAIGLVAALLLTRYMEGMLFGITPLDPIAYLAAIGALLVAALLASWLPAWRASTVDPVIALRNE